MTTPDPSEEVFATALLRVTTVLSGASTVAEVLGATSSLAVTAIDACDGASVLLDDGKRTTTIGPTDDAVRAVDQYQIDAGEGPGVDVVRGRTSEYADDLTHDERWSRFGSEAVAAGFRSVLSLRLDARDARCALNLYSRLPNAYGPTERAQGALFAAHATLILGQQRERTDAAAITEDEVRLALVRREVIGQAQGILMERDRLSSQQAFDVLRRASQHLNEKLSNVAQRLVDTGEDPDVGGDRASSTPDR